jgi:thiol-disulfide isomerase/thioredoxin
MVDFLFRVRKIFLLGIFLLVSCAHASAPTGPHLLAPMKPSSFDIYGKPYYLPKHPNKWVVINYWASWCGACVMEIPDLNKFAETAEQKDVVFFAINFDGIPASEQKLFARKYDISYTLLRYNPFGSLIPEDAITTLPVTYVISPKGTIQELNGAQSYDDLMGSIGMS